jgi:hypothetical protein
MGFFGIVLIKCKNIDYIVVGRNDPVQIVFRKTGHDALPELPGVYPAVASAADREPAICFGDSGTTPPCRTGLFRTPDHSCRFPGFIPGKNDRSGGVRPGGIIHHIQKKAMQQINSVSV